VLQFLNELIDYQNTNLKVHLKNSNMKKCGFCDFQVRIRKYKLKIYNYLLSKIYLWANI